MLYIFADQENNKPCVRVSPFSVNSLLVDYDTILDNSFTVEVPRGRDAAIHCNAVFNVLIASGIAATDVKIEE